MDEDMVFNSGATTSVPPCARRELECILLEAKTTPFSAKVLLLQGYVLTIIIIMLLVLVVMIAITMNL